MGTKVTIAFPGIGIDAFTVDKIAFSIGNVEVRWYGIILTLGIVAGVLYAMYRAKHEGFKSDDVLDYALWTVLLAIVGARLYYVLTTLKDAHGRWNYHSFLDVIAIWEGGLAIYGGIIGGCIGILTVCRLKKIRWQKVFDMIAPGVMIAQSLGRWGNFFNGEAYGYAIGETTKFYFFNTEHTLASGEGTLFHTLRMGLYNGFSKTYYHPTFLYESLWNLLGFVLINLFYKHKKFDGQIALLYFTWYGFGRMFIEGLRTDSLYLPGTTLRISQCLGLFFFVVGLTLTIVFSILKKNAPAPVLAEGNADTAEALDTAEEACDLETAPVEGAEAEATDTDPQITEEDEANGKAD